MSARRAILAGPAGAGHVFSFALMLGVFAVNIVSKLVAFATALTLFLPEQARDASTGVATDAGQLPTL